MDGSNSCSRVVSRIRLGRPLETATNSGLCTRSTAIRAEREARWDEAPSGEWYRKYRRDCEPMAAVLDTTAPVVGSVMSSIRDPWKMGCLLDRTASAMHFHLLSCICRWASVLRRKTASRGARCQALQKKFEEQRHETRREHLRVREHGCVVTEAVVRSDEAPEQPGGGFAGWGWRVPRV